MDAFEPIGYHVKSPPVGGLFTWLGMRDSNPRMLGPEPSALPLGESPVQIEIIALGGERVKLSDLAVARMYCGGVYST